MTPAELARFHAGDEAFFRELVERHGPRLFGIVRRYAREPDQAADLLQEVWVRIYRKRTHFRGTGSFLGWAAVLARNVCLNAVGATARRPEMLPLSGEMDFGADAGAESGPAMEDEGVNEALLALSPRQRDVVVSRVVEGMSVREVAARLGCAEGTVKATLHQALARMRTVLQGARDE